MLVNNAAIVHMAALTDTTDEDYLRVFKVNQWSEAGKRVVWSLLLLIPLAAIVVSSILTPQAQVGLLWAYLFYFLNGVLVYYFATALFSPSAFKYTPPGASTLRRW